MLCSHGGTTVVLIMVKNVRLYRLLVISLIPSVSICVATFIILDYKETRDLRRGLVSQTRFIASSGHSRRCSFRLYGL